MRVHHRCGRRPTVRTLDSGCRFAAHGSRRPTEAIRTYLFSSTDIISLSGCMSTQNMHPLAENPGSGAGATCANRFVGRASSLVMPAPHRSAYATASSIGQSHRRQKKERRAWTLALRGVCLLPSNADRPGRRSGDDLIRVPAEVHRRLRLEAAEEDISLNRLVSAKLSH